MVTPNQHGLATLAFAGVIATQSSRKPPYNVAIAGLSPDTMQTLINRYFPNADIELGAQTAQAQDVARTDEFTDLITLLVENATEDNEETRWLAHAVATACMASNHLWEDMGLPSRTVLSELLMTYFQPLASRNTGNMKWKKFFYRSLCEREGLNVCRAPSCSECNDYDLCFGPEESSADPE